MTPSQTRFAEAHPDEIKQLMIQNKEECLPKHNSESGKIIGGKA